MILLPANGDNAAIATRRLAPGESFPLGSTTIRIRETVLEGHRVAAQPTSAGELILSWGLPFGRALRKIAPGEYLCNARILAILKERHVDFPIPASPNFENYRLPFQLDEKNFRPGIQTPSYDEPRFFEGYFRSTERGAGTRNYFVILATSSRANSVARAVAAEFKNAKGVNGVVAVTHTEGGGPSRPNNFDLVVRTLNGFLKNPNVGAFVAIDQGDEPVNNRCLAVQDPPGAFVSIGGDFDSAVARAKCEAARLLPIAAAHQRTKVSVAHLQIGLQCGGSDAFSGVSGNPLVAWIARETIRCGGSANLAETSELIGAEPYVLANVRDLATARAFLETSARFQELAAWHGHTAEGNPSGGNLFRGLYNITIKSIGAALKKSADTRLDYVIDYAEPMPQPGFYFMNSPGNDLESIAGQVAAGCNMILFTTGNGSITNFPFVPTIKVMNTTRRFEMLSREMDFNAGRYLDGEPMDALGREAFELTLRVASGELSAGEKAGHAQTQLWREWRQTGPGANLDLQPLSSEPQPPHRLVLSKSFTDPFIRPFENNTFKGVKTEDGWATGAINLVVPTSLCSGQVATMIADAATRQSATRCVALPHTEGCGNSGGESERLMLRTLAGYAIHPLARRVLMLEHGCEKTHNDAFRNALSPGQASKLGWLSIQLDGGIQPVISKALEWFSISDGRVPREDAPISALRIGFAQAHEDAPTKLMTTLNALARLGLLVVVPESFSRIQWNPTVEYGQPAPSHGLHVMRTPTNDLTEILTGLGATGVELIVLWNAGAPVQHHPFIPVIEIGPELFENENPPAQLLSLIVRAASGEIPAASQAHADFQITRGLEGVSL
jgi:altronate dehydratase